VPDGAKPMLEGRGLQPLFNIRRGDVHPGHPESFRLEPGKWFGVVGESGSGKSVTMMLPTDPLHPHATALLSGGHDPDPKHEANRQRVVLQGDVPSPSNPQKGCNFCTRCPEAILICDEVKPE
jgi:oligopeptide/dipeptide ABC transporter ATP-binding protein